MSDGSGSGQTNHSGRKMVSSGEHFEHMAWWEVRETSCRTLRTPRLHSYKDRHTPGRLYTQLFTAVISEVVGTTAGFGLRLCFKLYVSVSDFLH